MKMVPNNILEIWKLIIYNKDERSRILCRGAKIFLLKRANEFSPNDIENEDLARQRRVLILSFRRSAPRRNAGFMGCFSTVSMELGAKGTRKEEDKGFALELE